MDQHICNGVVTTEQAVCYLIMTHGQSLFEIEYGVLPVRVFGMWRSRQNDWLVNLRWKHMSVGYISGKPQHAIDTIETNNTVL